MAAKKLSDFRYLSLSRKSGKIILSLKAETIARGDYVLSWYLDSLKALYANEYFPMAFSEETNAVQDRLKPQAEAAVKSFTPGQHILFAGVMNRLASPANGDLDDNYEILVLLQHIFSLNTFKGNPAHKLRFTIRHTGNRLGRILTLKEDLLALYGREACVTTISALQTYFHRHEKKTIHILGIQGNDTSALSHINYLHIYWIDIMWAFHDHTQRQDNVWIKAHFPQIVAIAHCFDAEAQAAKSDPVAYANRVQPWMEKR